MATRYDLIPKALWRYLNAAIRGLDADMSLIEQSIRGLDADMSLIEQSSNSALTGQNSTIYTENRILIHDSDRYPRQVTWTEDSLLSLTIQNPADSGAPLFVGYGTYGSYNHTTEPYEVPPGSEFVAKSSPLPIFCRFAAGNEHYVNVISERTA